MAELLCQFSGKNYYCFRKIKRTSCLHFLSSQRANLTMQHPKEIRTVFKKNGKLETIPFCLR